MKNNMATCSYCKKEYTRNSNSQKYCSPECQESGNNTKEKRAVWQRNRNDERNKKNNGNKIQCLICGRYYIQIGTHIVQRHEMTAREYKEHFDLERKKGLIPEFYKEIKKEAFWNNPTLENLKIGEKFWFKKGDEKAGKYKRSAVTLDRLKKLYLLKKK